MGASKFGMNRPARIVVMGFSLKLTPVVPAIDTTGFVIDWAFAALTTCGRPRDPNANKHATAGDWASVRLVRVKVMGVQAWSKCLGQPHCGLRYTRESLRIPY